MISRSAARPLRSALVALVAIAAIALSPLSAAAATHKVTAGLNWFTPSALAVPRGDQVRWSNVGDITLKHNIRSQSPKGYFGHVLREQTTWTFTFRTAGTFPYFCSLHDGMSGTITVPISVATLSGPVRFRITVGSGSSSAPWKSQVQVRAPGSSTFKTITTTTAASVTYTPAKAGTYTFRSRVTNTSTGASSDWSPTVSRSR